MEQIKEENKVLKEAEPEKLNIQEKIKKPKPSKILPSDRLSFEKQVHLIRAYAILSGNDRKPVMNQALADMLKVHPASISTANPFFSDIGLIIKGPNGYTPSEAVFAFNNAYEWGPDTAGLKLSPIIKDTWFATEIRNRLSFAPLPEKEVIAKLAAVSSATKEYQSPLQILVEFLIFSGIVRREGDMINIVKSSAVNPPGPNGNTIGTIVKTNVPPSPDVPSNDVPPKQNVNDTLPPSVDGITFSVNIKVAMAEMQGWQPDRIAALFEGLAKVITAKGGSQQ
ncbi:MAG: hypothetical protein ABSA71_17670 [Desulfomonilia bacterium]|jgi:hypothetical protein